MCGIYIQRKNALLRRTSDGHEGMLQEWDIDVFYEDIETIDSFVAWPGDKHIQIAHIRKTGDCPIMCLIHYMDQLYIIYIRIIPYFDQAILAGRKEELIALIILWILALPIGARFILLANVMLLVWLLVSRDGVCAIVCLFYETQAF